MGEVWDGNSLANPLLNLVRDDPSTQRHNITRLKSYSQPKVGEENITTLMFPKCKEEGKQEEGLESRYADQTACCRESPGLHKQEGRLRKGHHRKMLQPWRGREPPPLSHSGRGQCVGGQHLRG